MVKANTAARLKEIMVERNIKQVDILRAAKPFCEKYGVKLAKNDLSQYVNGKVEPGQEKLTILGLALNVSEAWLMGFDVPKNREINKEQPPVSGELSSDRQELYDFIDTLSEEQVKRLVQIAKAAFDQQTT